MALPGFQQWNDDMKKKVLDAMAAGGSAGKAAFDAANQRVTGSRDDALDTALARASAVNAPTGPGGPQDIIAGGMNNRLADLASSQAGWQNWWNAQQAAHTNYLDQVSAAAPSIEALTKQKLATRENELQKITAQLAAEAAEAAEKRAFERERMQHEREKWAADLAETRAKSTGGKTAKEDLPSLDELLGYAVEQQPAVANALPGAFVPGDTPGSSKSILGGPRMSHTTGPSQVGSLPPQVMQPNVTDIARNAGNALGMDPLTLAGLSAPGKQAATTRALAPPKPPPPPPDVKEIMRLSNTDEKTANTILKDKEYLDALGWAEGEFAKGTAWADIEATFRGNFLDRGPGKPRKTRTYDALVGYFLPRVRSRDALP